MVKLIFKKLSKIKYNNYEYERIGNSYIYMYIKYFYYKFVLLNITLHFFFYLLIKILIKQYILNSF